MRKIATKHNETKIRKAFLFFPRRIGYETRWLEFAVWRERYCNYYNETGLFAGCWLAEEWL